MNSNRECWFRVHWRFWILAQLVSFLNTHDALRALAESVIWEFAHALLHCRACGRVGETIM
ncbi:hypothetical protein M758_10G019600 [Ceratodon purpureus]|nr:hypothetical protein M758_10G019600 [Ceratodon purpureus]